MKIADLIANSVQVENYENPVTYDPDHTGATGYWLCGVCRVSSTGGAVSHFYNCRLKNLARGGAFNARRSPDMIYVVGPNESGATSPYKLGEIEKVVLLAKNRLTSSS